jgi:hypothetical protein
MEPDALISHIRQLKKFTTTVRATARSKFEEYATDKLSLAIAFIKLVTF